MKDEYSQSTVLHVFVIFVMHTILSILQSSNAFNRSLELGHNLATGYTGKKRPSYTVTVEPNVPQQQEQECALISAMNAEALAFK